MMKRNLFIYILLPFTLLSCGGQNKAEDQPGSHLGSVAIEENTAVTTGETMGLKERIDAAKMRTYRDGENRVEVSYPDFFVVGTEGVLFYATPDMLSGLCGWAFFDSNEPDAVVSEFGSGCSTVVSMTVVENARQGHRCFIGLMDPYVRPWVGKNELGFTIPFSRFTRMMETMKDCFLFDSHAWSKVRARLEE